MMDDDQLGSRLREQLEAELGDLSPSPDARARLRRGIRKRRRSPWFRASILVPVATALAITGLVLAIPALLNRDDEVKVTPAGRPPAVSVPAVPTPKATGTPVPVPAKSTASSDEFTTAKPKSTARETSLDPRNKVTAKPSTSTRVAKRARAATDDPTPTSEK